MSRKREERRGGSEISGREREGEEQYKKKEETRGQRKANELRWNERSVEMKRATGEERTGKKVRRKKKGELRREGKKRKEERIQDRGYFRLTTLSLSSNIPLHHTHSSVQTCIYTLLTTNISLAHVHDLNLVFWRSQCLSFP